ncbi:MAG: DUF2771 family protein [Mycobacteriaceae bacterium]
MTFAQLFSTLTSRTKKILAVIAVLFLTTVVAMTLVILKLNADHQKPLPTISAFTNGTLVIAKPLSYCNIRREDCVEGTAPNLTAPVGSVIQLVLPPEISAAPWKLTIEYLGPEGSEIENRFFRPEERKSITIGNKQETRQLLTIEVQLPSAVVTEEGLPLPRAFWSINTTPKSLLAN